MIINPETAIENGWVKGIHNKEIQVQPNAIDFTLDKAYSVNVVRFHLYLDDDGTENKGMRGGEVLQYNSGFNPGLPQNVWRIGPHGMIDCLSDMYVEIPDDVAVILFSRSSITRNGLLITSGLYDTGFKGHIGFLIHNLSEEAAYIGPGVRVGQCMFVSADSAGQYSGGWNHAQGTHTPNLN